MKCSRLLFLLWPSVVSIFLAAHATAQPSLAIDNVTVIDTLRGERIGPRSVLVRDGRIAAIERPAALPIPPNALRLNGHGLYLTPGLIDMHVHLFNNSSGRPPNEWAFPLFVANGVTAVREMRTEPAQIATVRRWREAVARGELVAPHILAAGVAVKGKSEDDARSKVRAAHAAGADFIKVFSEVPAKHWRAILAEARTSGLSLCGHVPAQVSLLESARAGQRSNEHLMQVYEACSTRETELLSSRKRLSGAVLLELRDAQEREALATFDPRICERTAVALAQSGQVQVPTLVLPYFKAHDSHSDYHLDPRWHYLRADEQARWEKLLDQTAGNDPALAAKRWEISRKIVAALHAAKVPILAGTDTPMPLVYPGFALHDELELLVTCGLTPADALRAATIEPAKFLGLAGNNGSIEVGKRADLLLLEADPLRRIENLRRIYAVVLDGRLLRRADLDALLRRSAH